MKIVKKLIKSFFALFGISVVRIQKPMLVREACKKPTILHPSLKLSVENPNISIQKALDELPSIVTDFGAVANHNGLTHQEQLWDEDAAEMSKMNWLPELAFFPNGGVFFYHSTEATSRFFRLWHELWQKSCQTLGRGRDQPALYAALTETGLSFAELSPEFNWQIKFRPHGWIQTHILHFYDKPTAFGTIFGKLLNAVPHVSLSTLKRLAKNAISDPYGWPNRDFISKRILEQNKTDSLSVAEQLWLNGRRSCAIRFQLGSLMQSGS